MQTLFQTRRLQALFALALPTLALLAVAAGVLAWTIFSQPNPGLAMPVNSAIETAYGVRVTQLAVTADGGLVDMRYTVLDADKAQTMMGDLATLPAIEDRASGTTLRLKRPMTHKSDLVPGRSYYILYVNAGGKLKAGGVASILMGDLRLEPIRVR